MDLNKLLVLDSDSNIDVEASVVQFRLAVTQVADKRRNDSGVIAEEVKKLYDRYPGAFIQIVAIKGMVLQSLGVDLAAYKEIGNRIHAYVQEWTEDGGGLTKTGQPARFVLRNGKGGGFRRYVSI